MTSKMYYIGFFKYQDSTIWQKTNLHLSRKELEDLLQGVLYIQKDTINIKEIELPN